MLDELRDNPEVLWGMLVAFGIVVLLTPAVGGMARLLGVVDAPEGRRLNKRPIPRLGGLAIFFGILVPSLAFLDLSGQMRGILLGAAVACVVGAVDDFRGLSPSVKLAGQLIAASIPPMFGVWIDHVTFPFVGVLDIPAWIGVPISMIFIRATGSIGRPLSITAPGCFSITAANWLSAASWFLCPRNSSPRLNSASAANASGGRVCKKSRYACSVNSESLALNSEVRAVRHSRLCSSLSAARSSGWGTSGTIGFGERSSPDAVICNTTTVASEFVRSGLARLASTVGD
jgi:hypothetical protein